MVNIPGWVTLVGVVGPLVTLAGSALAYVVKLYQDKRDRRRREFFELMQYIDGPNTIATKVAAVYSLRQFPEHEDFIVRFCDNQRGNVTGVAAQILVTELDLLKKHFVSEG